MNFLVLMILLAMLLTVLAVFGTIFLTACRLAKMQPPGYLRAAVVVITTAAIWAIIEAAFVAGLRKVYAAFGGPQWEVWLVGAFAGFPVSLLVGTLLHRVLMKVPMQKAIEVWFFERMIRYSFIVAGATAVAIAWLALK